MFCLNQKTYYFPYLNLLVARLDRVLPLLGRAVEKRSSIKIKRNPKVFCSLWASAYLLKYIIIYFENFIIYLFLPSVCNKKKEVDNLVLLVNGSFCSFLLRYLFPLNWCESCFSFEILIGFRLINIYSGFCFTAGRNAVASLSKVSLERNTLVLSFSTTYIGNPKELQVKSNVRGLLRKASLVE